MSEVISYDVPSAAFTRELREKLPDLLPGLMARALTLCKQRSEAQDLVQDTIVRALRFESGYQHDSNLRGWLQQILFSVFITRCRRSSRERRALSTLTTDPCAWTHPDMPTPGAALTRPVTLALDALPSQFAAVVRLVDLEERSYKDAANALAVPVGTVMSRLFRARRLLAAKLGAVPGVAEAA